jgi:hypothetical protein
MGKRWHAAMLAASMCVATAAAHAQPAPASEPPRPDATIFDTSVRVRLAWTEIPFRPARPKGWDEIVAPELRAGLRVLAGLFEGRAEIIVNADRFEHFNVAETDQLRSEVQLGLNTGAWSYLLEWKTRNIFEPGYDEFIIGQDFYAARVRHRFPLAVFDGLPVGLFQASVSGGYVASTPRLLQRTYADLELEWVQRFGGGFAIMVAPKLELADYHAFPPGDREDAVLSLRIAPSYNFGDGLTLSLEGQAVVAFSNLDIKTGESWELTPILRLQTAL